MLLIDYVIPDLVGRKLKYDLFNMMYFLFVDFFYEFRVVVRSLLEKPNPGAYYYPRV